ncbi:hypothetical protein GCM10023066_55510 [Nocardioides kongjuensis]
MNECGWSRLPTTTRRVRPDRIADASRSPAWDVSTRGPKKSEAATLTVGVADAARARSSSVRIPGLPLDAERGRSSVIGPATLP